MKAVKLFDHKILQCTVAIIANNYYGWGALLKEILIFMNCLLSCQHSYSKPMPRLLIVFYVSDQENP